MRILAFAFAGAALTTACSGVDGSVDGPRPATETSRTAPAPRAGDDAPSTKESRSAVCNAQAQKQCLERVEVPECEQELSVFTEAFVLALGRCVDGISTCESRATLYVCQDQALGEIAPGFPDLPEIARCKEKNVSCSTAYPRDRQIKQQVDAACESLVGLDAAARARGEACLAEQGCKQFAECLRDIY